MRKKRFLPLTAAVVLVAALAAVLGGTGSAAPQATTIKVGLVSDVGRFNDKSFNQSALDGLKRAQRILKIQGRAVESRSASDYVPNLASLARAGYSPTIGVGFLLSDGVNTAARQFPNSRFAIIDYSVKAAPFTDASKGIATPRNVRGLTFNTNENSYMIGCLAGLMTKRAGGQQVISAVGGLDIPTVSIFIAGYRAGAKRCNKGINVLIDFSQDFGAQDKCKELALNQIAKGSRVVFQVAGGCGLGTLTAAAQAKIWGIGVDKDQYKDAKRVLTSGVKKVGLGVFQVIKATKEGKFRGNKDLQFTLKNGGMGVGKINPAVPKKFITAMNKIKTRIIKGKLKVPTKLT